MIRIELNNWVQRLVLCLLIGSYSSVAAQESGVLGTITDASTGETIPLVNILKIGTTIGTNSNEIGEYELALPPGLHELRYSSLVYVDTLVTVRIEEGNFLLLDLTLREDRLILDEIVISADRSTRMVQQLAVFRDNQNEGLRSYSADLYKLAILGKENTDSDTVFTPLAYSERVSEVKHIITPERFSESVTANRSSKNFFSEYDFFSTGGPPLNLNQELVPLSILSEDITVIGPISKRAGRFYIIDDIEAGDDWPVGTREITFTPIQNNRPLFEGFVWFNENTSTILGIDVTLNDYASTNNGLFSISNLRYQQSYINIDGYWLPDNTKLSAQLDFLTATKPITYLDEWSWSNHEINPANLNAEDLSLNTLVIEAGSNRKRTQFWDSVSTNSANDNLSFLTQAKSYNEKNRTLRLGMSVMSNFFRLPYQLERFYLTNISDIYHYNRVEGHSLGLGVRTPVHPNFEYRAITKYGFSSKEWTYSFSGYHFIPGTAFAPELVVYKDVVQQYQDYEYNRTPLDFFEFRHSMAALINGSPVNNYFLRKGIQAGLRYRFDIESFIRVLYLEESHDRLFSNTDFTLFGDGPELRLFPNTNLSQPTDVGRMTGLSLHLHHDTRKYLRTQFLRDYNIRDFGWLFDAKLEKGIADWGSDFDYNRYRIGLKFNVPVFSSHFIQTDLIVGASDAETPSQRLFNLNGFVMDDYVRERPFNTVSFKEPIGSRVSILKVKYKFGSSITRKAPFDLVQKSGIHLATFFTIGTVDQNSSLQPLLPYSGSETQAEIGIAAFKIFGFIYAEFSRRIVGDYGNSVGFQILF